MWIRLRTLLLGLGLTLAAALLAMLLQLEGRSGYDQAPSGRVASSAALGASGATGGAGAVLPEYREAIAGAEHQSAERPREGQRASGSSR